MVESQTQVKPQFIMWDRKCWEFRRVEKIEMPSDYLGHDLTRCASLSDSVILADNLRLVGSAYLGPINVSEQEETNFDSLRQHKLGIMNGIVNLAQRVAQEAGIPYFSVNIVETGKDRTWRLANPDEYFKDFYIRECARKYFSIKSRDFDIPNKTIERETTEFVLHPTAQLYIPRR